MTFKEGIIIAEHYELKRQLGQGSFGDVWLAHNLLADIDVAIKFYGTLDQKGIEDFRNEFKIAYRLHHPNLLNISHFDVFENCPYLVMPFCENGSVSHRIGQMPETEIWKFILDVSCGLSFLHNQNPPVVHQDIKPDNILITSDGRYVISDFGISRSFRTQMSRSRTNNKINSSGTLAYMGPERFSEKPMVVLASDIWALGMTIYETITGDVLWEGMGGCVQLNGARIPALSGVSPELSRLVSACLAAETWNRPTAEQIHEYAAAYIQHKQLPPITFPNTEEPTQKKELQQRPEKKAERFSLPPADSISQVNHSRPAYQQREKKKQFENSNLLSTSNPTIKRLLMAVAALFGIIVIGAGAMFFHNSINEEQDFISCKTKEDFEQFIKEHPSSSYVTAARKRIEALTPAIKSAESVPTEATPVKASMPVGLTPQPAKEKVKIIEKTVSQHEQVDDRIEIQPSESKTTSNSTSSNTSLSNLQNDDAVFYACQTIGDYQSYLNTYPNGKYRSQAQAAINNLLNRNDNIANGSEPEKSNYNPRNNANQDLPPRSYRQRNSSVGINVNTGGYRGGTARSGGRPARGGGARNNGGGSAHRHSN